MIAFTQRIRLAVADDHPLVVLAIERLIANAQNIEIVCRAQDSTGLVEALENQECDVIIMDFYMPGGEYGDGIDLIKYTVEHHPESAIVVLSMTRDADLIARALDAGANAVVSKQDRLELIYVAIVTVLAHEDYLGPALALGAAYTYTDVKGYTTVSEQQRPHEVPSIRFADGLRVVQAHEHLRGRHRSVG